MNTKISQYVPWLILLLIMLGAGWLRYNLVDVPMERDEGEYAYGGQLLLQGIPPYLKLYNMKLPGIYAAYAGILAIFGQTHTGVHLGLLAVNSLTIFLVFLLSRALAGPAAGIGAALFYALISMGQPVQGIFANSEHFVLPPALLGAYLLFQGRKKRGWLLFCSGLFMGLAFLVKQHGVAFILFGGCFLVGDHLLNRADSWRRLSSRCLLYFSGVFVPYVLMCLWLVQAGVFETFWFWTVEYARAYTGQVSWNSALYSLQSRGASLFSAAPLYWSLALVGVPLLFFSHNSKKDNRFFIICFVFFSFVAICPGLYFRPHYFVLLLPAAAILAGGTVDFVNRIPLLVNKQLRAVGAGLLLLVVLASSVYQQRDFLFERDMDRIIRSTYWPNPFSESLPIAQFIAENSTAEDTIAVIGSEPQIYFYANRKSASGYIYMYPLMEQQPFALEMQENLIREIENSKPKYLLFVRIDLSWLQKVDSHTLIYDWFKGYKENYHRVGMVEIYNRTSLYSWRQKVKWPPTSPYWIEILERSEELPASDG